MCFTNVNEAGIRYRYCMCSSNKYTDFNKNITLEKKKKKISLHLAERFQRRRLKCEKLTDDGRQVMAKAHIAFGKVS